jgi:hypothetical protein
MSFTLCNSRSRLCKTWKGSDNTINSVIPGNSRPLNPLIDGDIFPHTPFKANPIKHWRKQMVPLPGSGNSKATVSQVMDTPGGTVNRNKDFNTDCSYPNVIKTHISNLGTCDICPNPRLNNHKNIMRSASTLVKKNYYTTQGAYLRSRVKLYSQNQTISHVNKADSEAGFNSVYCSDTSTCNFVKVIYKPNNKKYSQQGAVSNDLRIANLKLNVHNLELKHGKGSNKFVDVPCCPKKIIL